MKRVAAVLMVAAVLSLAVVTPALADRGGAPNEYADWGQLRKAYGQRHGPGSIGDVMSNSHWGNNDTAPPTLQGRDTTLCPGRPAARLGRRLMGGEPFHARSFHRRTVAGQSATAPLEMPGCVL